MTNEQFMQLKNELIREIKSILASGQSATRQRKCLKSHEVLRLLAISPNTLKSLRDNGALPYTRIGGVIFYNYDDIQNMLEKYKIQNCRRALDK